EGEDLEKQELEEIEPSRLKLKNKFETYSLESGEFEEEEEEEADEDEEDSEIKREAESSVADSVKSNLRDIGKIPLFNKKTKTTNKRIRINKNEKKIYHSYRSKIDDPKKKREMLDAVKANKEKIGETIRTIKFSNKLIRKFCKKIEKYITKFNEKEVVAQASAA